MVESSQEKLLDFPSLRYLKKRYSVICERGNSLDAVFQEAGQRVEWIARGSFLVLLHGFWYAIESLQTTVWPFSIYNIKDFKVKEVVCYKYFIVIIIISKIQPSICNRDSPEYGVSIISCLMLNAIEFS